MQVHFFSIPLLSGESESAAVNAVLQSHRVVDVQKHFVPDGSNSWWAVCVTTVSTMASPPELKKGRVDYREILSTEDFDVFARLRLLRKQLADKDGVPPYAVFTNEQLADMVRNRVQTLSGLQEINGVGPARAEKYGAATVAELSRSFPAVAP